MRRGYVVNRNAVSEQKYEDLKKAVGLLENVFSKELLLTSDQATDLFDVIRDYTYALDTLDAYDYQSLKIADTTAPGRLPNIVTVDNIFTTRFARNPLISRVLTEMELVRELNESVPRIFEEMKAAGLPEPKIVETTTNVTVVLYNGKTAANNVQTA